MRSSGLVQSACIATTPGDAARDASAIVRSRFDPASSPKLGLTLWNQVDVTIALEVGLLVAGGALYLGATAPRSGRKAPTLVASGLFVVLTIATPFLPVATGPAVFAYEALGGYLLLAAIAQWMDRSRERLAI